MKERGLAPRDSRRDARGAHYIFTVKEAPPCRQSTATTAAADPQRRGTPTTPVPILASPPTERAER